MDLVQNIWFSIWFQTFCLVDLIQVSLYNWFKIWFNIFGLLNLVQSPMYKYGSVALVYWVWQVIRLYQLSDNPRPTLLFTSKSDFEWLRSGQKWLRYCQSMSTHNHSGGPRSTNGYGAMMPCALIWAPGAMAPS